MQKVFKILLKWNNLETNDQYYMWLNIYIHIQINNINRFSDIYTNIYIQPHMLTISIKIDVSPTKLTSALTVSDI